MKEIDRMGYNFYRKYCFDSPSSLNPSKVGSSLLFMLIFRILLLFFSFFVLLLPLTDKQAWTLHTTCGRENAPDL